MRQSTLREIKTDIERAMKNEFCVETNFAHFKGVNVTIFAQ